MIEWYISNRQEGKTQDLIDWVKQGVRTSHYPGWSRIIVVPDMEQAQRLRGGDPKTNKYGLEYHQVFYVSEWLHAYGTLDDPIVEIGVDNVDMILARLLNNPAGRVVRATATGKVLEVPRHVHLGKPHVLGGS
jgi:hypothetical protein